MNPQVYMDVKIGNKPAGRMRFLLRADIVPMTAGGLASPAQINNVATFVTEGVTLLSADNYGILK